jgi:manganese transport protein
MSEPAFNQNDPAEDGGTLNHAPAETRHVSLEGIDGTVAVPHHQAGFWRQWRAYAGPAILVSVGYMDPGNWGTDL